MLRSKLQPSDYIMIPKFIVDECSYAIYNLKWFKF